MTHPQNSSPSERAERAESRTERRDRQAGRLNRTNSNSKDSQFWKNIIAGGVAIFAVLGFAALIILIATLLSNAAMNAAQWERYTYLLAGVEAITFTAIGWFFGKEVHREQAQQAELRANMTQNALDTVAKENTKGRMVAKASMEQAKDSSMEFLVKSGCQPKGEEGACRMRSLPSGSRG